MHARMYIYVIGCWLGGVVPDFNFTENVMTGASYRQKWSFVVFVSNKKSETFRVLLWC